MAQKPAELLNHVINTEWYVKGMTYTEFIDLHTGSQFDFSELERNFNNICEDYPDNIKTDKPMMCIFFCGKVLYEIGPESRKVKGSMSDKTWIMHFPYNKDNKLIIKTAYISTFKNPSSNYKGEAHATKIVLTIKQASLLAVEILGRICTRAAAEVEPKILLTPLAGAVFSKEDIKALAQELKVSLGTVVRVVNKSCQSGAHYLDESDIHVAAVAAITATKAMTNKNLRMSIIRKTLRQFQTAGKHFNHDTFKIYSQRSSGGLPEDMLPEKLVEDYEAYREVASKEARALRENARKLKEEEEAKKAEAEKAKTQAAAEELARELALKLSDKNIGGESSNAPVTPDTQESQKPPAKPKAK